MFRGSSARDFSPFVENSMDLESPLGVFAMEDAQHIVLALENPKRVTSQWG